MDLTIPNKLPQVGTTIFTVMSQLANECGAINLSQGFPDFDVPAPLRQLLHEHCERGNNQYSPMPGVPALREQIALLIERAYAQKVNVDAEITVTTGATEALFAAFSAMVSDGDEVIVLDPAYDSYAPAITLAGGRPVHVPLLEGGFAVDWDRVRAAVNTRTRMIVINTPHNPTGAVLMPDDLQALWDIVEGTNVLVLSDEVYEFMTFDDQPHQSILRHEGLRSRALVVSSFGKTYHATGWKVGYTVAPPALTSEFRKVHQFLNFCTMTPAQFAYADFLAMAPQHPIELPRFYQSKRDTFANMLSKTRFKFTPTPGTYFQCADYSAVSDLPDTEFARWLTTEHGVAVIPVSVFYRDPPPDQKIVRFCFAKDDETIAAAGERLCQL